MRTARLTGRHKLQVAAQVATAVVAEVWHVAIEASGMEVATPVGYLCAAPRPGGAEERAHWHADLFLRSDVPRAMRDEALPEQIADWLLADTDCMEPLIVSVHEGQNTDLVERGRILDD